MGNPYLNRNESIILATHKVVVKSVSSDVLLTSERLIIVDSGHEQFLPHTIPLAVIETVTYRENPDGDPEISLSITPPTLNDAPLTITLSFSSNPGEPRSQESGEWVTKLRESIAAARETALRTGEKPVYPEIENTNRDIPPGPPAPGKMIRLSSRQQSSRSSVASPSLPEGESTGEPAESVGSTPAEMTVPGKAPMSPVEVAENKVRSPIRIPPAVPARSVKRSTIFVVTAIIAFIFVIAAGVFLVSSSFQEKPHAPVVPTAIPAASPVPTPIPTEPVTIPATPLPSGETTTVIPTKQQLGIPQTGVWVRVNTVGNFSGSIGPAGRMQQVEGTGSRFFQIPARDEIVEAAIQKKDGSGNPLTVEIYNNGVLAGNTTITSPNGFIDLHVDLKTP